MLPGPAGTSWRQVIDTADEQGFLDDRAPVASGTKHLLPRCSFALFEQRSAAAPEGGESPAAASGASASGQGENPAPTHRSDAGIAPN